MNVLDFSDRFAKIEIMCNSFFSFYHDHKESFFMIEFFTDHTEEFIFYSMYIHFVFYLFFTVSYQWVENHSSPAHYHHFYNLSFRVGKKLDQTVNRTASYLIIYLPKTIRRKDSRGDEPDGPLFLL